MRKAIFLALLLATGALLLAGCDAPAGDSPTSTTGVKMATAKVAVQSSGLTVEQENIKRRLEAENMPGAIKHLYVISAYSGDVLIYSTVKGKVTSSGKRLSPYSVAAMDGEYCGNEHEGIGVRIGGSLHATGEVMQDDGTYGNSIHYLYWWDSQDRYHQHYIAGGQIVHVGDQPLAVGKVVINLDTME